MNKEIAELMVIGELMKVKTEIDLTKLSPNPNMTYIHVQQILLLSSFIRRQGVR